MHNPGCRQFLRYLRNNADFSRIIFDGSRNRQKSAEKFMYFPNRKFQRSLKSALYFALYFSKKRCIFVAFLRPSSEILNSQKCRQSPVLPKKSAVTRTADFFFDVFGGQNYWQCQNKNFFKKVKLSFGQGS